MRHGVVVCRYLLDLDYSGDPAWECIIEMHQWMMKLLLSCKQEFQDTSGWLPVMLKLAHYIANMLYLWTSSSHSFWSSKDGSCSESSQRSAGHRRTFSNQSQGSSGSGGFVPSISGRGLGGARGLGVIAEVEKRTEHSKPARIEFIERLTEIFSNSLPNHYRLGQAHFNRTLFTVCEICTLSFSLLVCLPVSLCLCLSVSLWLLLLVSLSLAICLSHSHSDVMLSCVHISECHRATE